jgi:hypothetical protein
VRRRDELLVWDERVKLFATFLNAFALDLIGFAVLRPATEDLTLLSLVSIGWGGFGLAIHVLGHYVLGQLKTERQCPALISPFR